MDTAEIRGCRRRRRRTRSRRRRPCRLTRDKGPAERAKKEGQAPSIRRRGVPSARHRGALIHARSLAAPPSLPAAFAAAASVATESAAGRWAECPLLAFGFQSAFSPGFIQRNSEEPVRFRLTRPSKPAYPMQHSGGGPMTLGAILKALTLSGSGVTRGNRAGTVTPMP